MHKILGISGWTQSFCGPRLDHIPYAVHASSKKCTFRENIIYSVIMSRN